MRIEIYPLNKVVIDGAAVCLGAERSVVECMIGKGQAVGTRYYYFNNEVAVDYCDDKVEFIEFLSGIDGEIKPIVYEASAFEMSANDLLDILKDKNKGAVSDNENGYSYQFHNISVGIYREAIPDEVEEMIKEAASFGNHMSDDEIRCEMKRADHWATIGIGIAGYYDKPDLN